MKHFFVSSAAGTLIIFVVIALISDRSAGDWWFAAILSIGAVVGSAVLAARRGSGSVSAGSKL